MTKPIEGWVLCLDNERIYHEIGSMLIYDTKPSDECNYRPVRITFTDEYQAVTNYKHLDPVRNDQYDKQVEEALREERERIWEWLDSNGILFLLKVYCPASMKYNEETEQNIKRAIFGEEK